MTTVILVVVAFLVGGALSYLFFRYGLKSKYESVIKEAENEDVRTCLRSILKRKFMR